MPTIYGLFSVTGPVTIAAPAAARAGAGTTSTTSGRYGDMKQIYRRVMELDRALAEAARALEKLGGGRRISEAGEARSASDLGITAAPRCSSLSSTEELNTIPTSYSTHVPAWSASSTSPVHVGGTFAGGFSGTMRFQVASNDTILGAALVRIRVFRDGVQGEQLAWPSGAAPGATQTTADGLEIGLGDGWVRRNDTFEVQVSSTVDSAVDPVAAFDGTGDDGPELEPGQAVTAGSFTVNGVPIAVAADDSVQGVLDKVNTADAGVTASYDADTERVSMVRDEAGAEDIVLADDSSGFLAAAKLDGATATLGAEGGGADDPMASLDAFAGVSAGSFSVNGVEVALDPATDSLLDVLDRISAEVEGVSATWDEEAGCVTIAAEAAGEGVDLEDGGTGIVAGLALTEGPHAGRTHAGVSRLASRRAATALASVERALERLWDLEVTDSVAGRSLQGVRARIGQALTQGLGDAGATLAAAGLQLDPDAEAGDNPMRLVVNHLDRALRGAHGADLKEILVGSPHDRTDGLLGVLSTAGLALEDSLGATCGSLGVYLDTWA
ncbi:MAG: flagellin hook IN motif-containing protein [Pseudomonadota bacterium]